MRRVIVSGIECLERRFKDLCGESQCQAERFAAAAAG